MKVESVILAGLRRTGAAATLRPATPSRILEQQEKEAEYGQHDEGNESAISEDDARPPAYRERADRRQSSIIEELTRQASVLWDTEPEHEEGATTTDDDDEPSHKTI